MQINLMGSIDWPSSSPMSTSLSLSILTSIADSKCLNITGGTSSETKTSNSHRSVRGSGAGIHPLGLHPMGLTRGDDFLGQLDGLITPLIRYPLKDILQNYHTLASNFTWKQDLSPDACHLKTGLQHHISPGFNQPFFKENTWLIPPANKVHFAEFGRISLLSLMPRTKWTCIFHHSGGSLCLNDAMKKVCILKNLRFGICPASAQKKTAISPFRPPISDAIFSWFFSRPTRFFRMRNFIRMIGVICPWA